MFSGLSAGSGKLGAVVGTFIYEPINEAYGIPAIMIFKGGQLVQQFMGVQPKERLQQALDEAKSA